VEDEMSKKIAYTLMGSGVLAVALVAAAARPIAAAIQGAGALGGFHHGWGGPHGFRHMSPEAAKEHLQVAAKWALRDVDASEQQQERVTAIAAGAVDDLFRLRDRHVENREAFHAQLGGASVDRAALEEIRKSELALADEASKRLVRAMADIADVLTPEQRQALVEKHSRRHGR
jgi:Spy/CpxP family protein refolding chaperone